MSGAVEERQLPFWEHVEELRSVLLRGLAAVAAVAVAAFACRDALFEVVLAPRGAGFITYRALCRLAEWLSLPGACPQDFWLPLINTELPAQLLVHVRVAFYAGLLVALPYALHQAYRFVLPALRGRERRYSPGVLACASLLFYAGVLLCYFVVFPFSLRFLATYRVSAEVENLITLTSYVDTLLLLSLMLGLMAELPVVAWFLAKLGVLSAALMRRYRKHAAVLLLALLAVITPTTDAVTLVLVFAPIYALYEASIAVVRRAARG